MQKVIKNSFAENWDNTRMVRDYAGEFYRHTRRVRKLKIITISLVSVIILSLIIWPLTNAGHHNFKLSIEDDFSENGEEVSMVKPKFFGKDKNNQPFNITADSAVQKSNNTVLLENINADILLKGDDWITLLSQKGVYNTENKSMDLSGKVNLMVNNGYEMVTETAFVDLDKNMATGNDDVTVHGPLGVMKAKGFVIRDNGKSIIFHGGVKVKTNPPKDGKKGAG